MTVSRSLLTSTVDESLTTARTYLRIEPTTDSLDPSLVETTITRLHGLLAAESGFRSREQEPTVEILLVATGDAGPTGDRALTYYVGISNDDRFDELERTFRNCLPASYAITETTTTLVDALALPVDADSTEDTRSDEIPPATEDVLDDGTHPSADGDADADPATTDGGTDTAAPLTDSPPTNPALADYEAAGVEFKGVGERYDDWQTRLTPMTEFMGEDTARWPLASVADALVGTDVPVAFQTLLQPRQDWSGDAEMRIDDLRYGQDTLAARLFDYFMASSEDDFGPKEMEELADVNAERVEEIREKDARRSFTVNARAVAIGTDATATEAALQDVTTTFEGVANTCYRVTASAYSYGSKAATNLFTRVCTRRFQATASPLRRLLHRVPGGSNTSPAIVTDPTTVGNFCLLGGAHLSAETQRALGTTPPERTGHPLPANETLQPFVDAEGMPLVRPTTANRTTVDTPVTLPPALQPLHTVILGRTGSGKSAVGLTAQLANHDATDGATIIVDTKGAGLPESYLRAHFSEYDDLEDVYCFECREILPATPIFDIRPQLEAGISREQAVENVADHYEEVLMAYMGEATYKEASRSTDVISALIKALFDSVHGADTFSHRRLLGAARRLHETETPPPVSDPNLRNRLGSVTAGDHRTLDAVMEGVRHRTDKAIRDRRIATLFDHVADADSPVDDAAESVTGADADAATADAAESVAETPQFDFAEYLDEDCVIVLDLSGYREQSRNLLTLVLLSKLWTALQRRMVRYEDSAVDPPLVNLHLEEATDLAASGILDDLLAQGRGFGVGVTLSMQFPSQLRADHERAYWELINDVGTKVVGNVGVDRDLAASLATGSLSRQEIADRLRDLARGEWLVRLPAQFGAQPPQPFVGTSLPLPPGHPDGDAPLSGTDETRYEAHRALVAERARQHGLDVTNTAPTMPDDQAVAEAGPASVAEGIAETPGDVPAETTLPHTDRLPDCVEYDPDPHALECGSCGTRYPPRTEGMQRAIECCHSLADVDPDDIPICRVDLMLSRDEREACAYSDTQLRFLAAVYMAHQQQFYRSLEYDIVWDSMIRLREYVGIGTEAIDELVEDGLLVVDCTNPYTLYTVTAEGRDLLQVGHREGIAYGDGAGDLSESSFHVAMVEAGARLLAQELVDAADSPAVEVSRYHEIDEGRLDAAALDANGNPVATLEAERSNNDTLRAVPDDFDKMAAQDPQDAFWVVKNRATAHEVLQALNDPTEGDPRVEKTYSENMAPREFTIDEPGFTEIITFQRLRRTLLDANGPEYPP